MFKLDSPLMNFLGKVADMIILNLMIVVFSIPVFTIGAALSAAYYIGFKMVKNEESYIIRGFWKAFKENFKQATIIWLLMLGVITLLVADFRIVAYSGIEFAKWIQIAMIVVTSVLLMGAMYIFPLQARFVNTVKNTIKNAFFIALSYLPSSILLIAVYAVPVALVYFLPQTMPVVLALGLGALIYVKSMVLVRILKRYEPQPDAAGQNAENDDEGIFDESDRIENGVSDEAVQGTAPVKVFRDGRFVELTKNSDGEANL